MMLQHCSFEDARTRAQGRGRRLVAALLPPATASSAAFLRGGFMSEAVLELLQTFGSLVWVQPAGTRQAKTVASLEGFEGELGTQPWVGLVDPGTGKVQSQLADGTPEGLYGWLFDALAGSEEPAAKRPRTVGVRRDRRLAQRAHPFGLSGVAVHLGTQRSQGHFVCAINGFTGSGEPGAAALSRNAGMLSHLLGFDRVAASTVRSLGDFGRRFLLPAVQRQAAAGPWVRINDTRVSVGSDAPGVRDWDETQGAYMLLYTRQHRYSQ